MTTLRFLLALWIGKSARLFVRLIGQGSGTALPGLLALNIDPTFLHTGLKQLKDDCIVISGTNGKTTTAQMVRAVMKPPHQSLLMNKEGSNLLRGIASSIIEHSRLDGHIQASLGLFELDEATLPLLLDIQPPRILVLLNLFRDQLDRYGEVDLIRKKWADAIKKLPTETRLVLNADDPLVASLGKGWSNVVFFGIDDVSAASEKPASHLDVRACPSCGGKLAMRNFFASHLCHYQCQKCSFHRPKPDIAAIHIISNGLEETDIGVVIHGKRQRLTIPIPGLPAVYSTLATCAVAHILELDKTVVLDALRALPRPFGRWERIEINGQKILLILIKNPAGASAVLDTLAGTKHNTLLLALNDNLADGTDVSWIWDTPFEKLPGAKRVIVTGTRANDLALRFKYAERKTIEVVSSLKQAIIRGLHVKHGSDTGSLTILATYTAMLAIRKILTGSHLGGVQE
ncbi:MAG: MurT ligase domain-containing protein [bacterium]|nr:MurT ligase domain-containing protein [bacterium]